MYMAVLSKTNSTGHPGHVIAKSSCVATSWLKDSLQIAGSEEINAAF
jgi:hypothetical protein